MKLNNNLILSYESFLTVEECNSYINYFNNDDKIKKYRDTFTLGINDTLLLNKLKDVFKIDKLQNPDNLEIVQWPKDSFMGPHYDTGDSLAFIIYLNENYKGGETVIENLKIKPRTGKIVIFSNGKLEHEVNKIEEGTRYTLIGWYK
jgi:hypothetical protein